MFTENLDVTSYEHGKRETHNPIGRAFAPVVWDYYQVRYGIDASCICLILNSEVMPTHHMQIIAYSVM